jgi:hypothetical protein
MTPKEKAEQLVDKFRNDLFQKRHVSIYKEDAILIALIAVDEIIKEWSFIYNETENDCDYWNEVKQEIEKL